MINWFYKGQEVDDVSKMPPCTHSFIYMITNLTNGKKYIGRKQVIAVRNKKITEKQRLKPEYSDRRKKKITTITESKDWKKYIGSNIPLKEDIGKGDLYKKEILYYCQSKSQVTYYEVKAQFEYGVLESDDYYNDNILGKIYRTILDAREC